MDETRTKLQKDADSLWSQIVKARDPICRFCGRSATTDACHIVTRESKGTRFALFNGLGGCRTCHRIFDSSKKTKREMAIRVIGDGNYWDLVERSRVNVRYSEVFLRERCEFLKKLRRCQKGQ